MDGFRPVQLAQLTFPWLSVQVTRVASQKVDPKLGKLGGHLCIFAERIQHLSDSQKRRLERDGIVQNLLVRLEAAFSVPPQIIKTLPIPSHLAFPLLENAAAAIEDANESGRRGRQALALVESVIVMP